MAGSEQREERNGDVLREFRASFFSMKRLASFPWSVLENNLQNDESAQFISDLLKETCLHPLCQKFPPSVRFRRLFLTELIKRQEAAACDPLDELYDALAEAVGVEETSECYKSYFLPSGDAVSLVENVALISEGTTGLVTWEAALYLTEWVLENQQVFTGRSVLELGSGVGLAGIAICHSCSPNSFVFSDCHASVLQKLRRNVHLNGLSEQSSPAVRVDELDWTTATEETIREIEFNVVVAAGLRSVYSDEEDVKSKHVVYDPDVAGSLVELLTKILTCSSSEMQPDIFICSTVRNPETYGGFKQQLENAGISHQLMTEPVQHVFPYNRVAPIELIKLFRVQEG